MDVLRDLIKRLERLELTQDPVEAKALGDWLKAGGLESVKPALIAQTDAIEAKAVEPIPLKVRKFDEWKEQTFEVLSYTTAAEFEDALLRHYGLKGIKFRFTYTPSQGEVKILPYTKNSTLGEVLGSYEPKNINVTVVPINGCWQGPTNLPVHVIIEEKNHEEKILVPITQDMTIQQLGAAIRRQLSLSSEKTIGFLFENAKGESLPYLSSHQNKVWEAWVKQRYGMVSAVVS